MSKFISLISILTFLVFSCSNPVEVKNKNGDSIAAEQPLIDNDNSKDSTDDGTIIEKPEKPFRLSPADSSKVADSIHNSKNGVRDFN